MDQAKYGLFFYLRMKILQFLTFFFHQHPLLSEPFSQILRFRLFFSQLHLLQLPLLSLRPVCNNQRQSALQSFHLPELRLP